MELPKLAKLKGWYRSVEVADLDGNGFPDLILGNQGLNTRFKAKSDSPIRMYLNDFDQNGSIEQIFTATQGDIQVPFTLKHELEKQIPTIKKKYMRYSNYSETIDINQDGIIDLILGGNLSGVKPEIGKSDASFGEVLIGNGDGTFRYLPNAQHQLKLSGEIRAISRLNDQKLLIVKNNSAAEIWKYDNY
jgi:hypothetical protein